MAIAPDGLWAAVVAPWMAAPANDFVHSRTAGDGCGWCFELHKLRRRDWWLGRRIEQQWNDAGGNLFDLSGCESEWLGHTVVLTLTVD
jgi:hypothetical protein